MAGFTDLLPLAQPTLCHVTASATAGTDWLWEFTGVTDEDGADIDLTAATGTCAILDTPGGSVIADLVVTGNLGGFTISLDEAETATLATTSAVRATWRLTFTVGTDTVRMWGPTGSHFTIYPN